MRIPAFMFCALGAWLSLSGASAQNDSLPRFKQGTSYRTIRADLLKRGWQPVRVPRAPGCGGQDNCFPFRAEAVFCGGTGAAFCLYAWRRGKVGIEVWTQGEQDPPAFSSLKRCQSLDWNWGQQGKCA